MQKTKYKTKEKTKTCQNATLADGKCWRRRTVTFLKRGELMPKGETHRESKEWPVDVDNLERTKVTVFHLPPQRQQRTRKRRVLLLGKRNWWTRSMVLRGGHTDGTRSGDNKCLIDADGCSLIKSVFWELVSPLAFCKTSRGFSGTRDIFVCQIEQDRQVDSWPRRMEARDPV